MNVTGLFRHWNNVRQGLFAALDKLPDDQLGYSPRPGLRTFHEITCHIAGAEDGWFRYCVTHELRGWEEAEYQPSDYPTGADLKKLLSDVHTRVESLYADEGDRKIKELVVLPWGAQVEQEWIVWHVIEHEIHHRGEIYLMLGLLGIEAPDV